MAGWSKGGRCERWGRGRNRGKSQFTMKSRKCDGIHRRCDAKGGPTRRAREEGEVWEGEIKVRKQNDRKIWDKTHRLSTLASPKHQMRTYHFLQNRISWSLLFRKEVGQVIISTRDQLQPGRNRWEDDDDTSTRSETFIRKSAVKFRWVQDAFEPTKSDDDTELEKGNTDSVKTAFDPNNARTR